MTREIALHCMKSYSELHSDLCELCPIYGETGSDHCFEDALQYVIGMLEQESRWIPVSERLPKIHNYTQEYIVTIKGNYIRTAFFTETNGKSWWSIDNVIAWMPLPQAYSEVEE